MSIQRCPLSKSNTFDQNFMKLGHIVKYQDVFKFDNAGLTLPFAIVAICYKNDRVATDFFHWQKVHFRQIISPFSPIMVQNLLTGDLGKHVCPEASSIMRALSGARYTDVWLYTL